MLVITADIPDMKFDGDVIKCKPKELSKHIGDATYILCTVTTNLQDLTAAKNLKLISTISAGVDHINTKYCKAKNIKIGHTPNILSDAVADVCIGLILMTMRKLAFAAEQVTKQDKNLKEFSLINDLVGTDIKNKVIGIVGLGGIGFEIAKRLSAFGVNKILYYGPHGPKPVHDFVINNHIVSLVYVPLEELLKQSDLVILSCALNSATTNMANEAFFKKMKNTAFFYNIARGKLVDTDALVKALENKEIAGAGLDVVEPEPIAHNHKLLKMKNVVVLPHIGSAAAETRGKMMQLALENLRNFKEDGTLICEYSD